jgi:hypothetical protein
LSTPGGKFEGIGKREAESYASGKEFEYSLEVDTDSLALIPETQN